MTVVRPARFLFLAAFGVGLLYWLLWGTSIALRLPDYPGHEALGARLAIANVLGIFLGLAASICAFAILKRSKSVKLVPAVGLFCIANASTVAQGCTFSVISFLLPGPFELSEPWGCVSGLLFSCAFYIAVGVITWFLLGIRKTREHV